MLARIVLILVALSAVTLGGGCSREAPREITPVASPLIPADPSATEDVPGRVACETLTTAVRDATLMSPGVVDAIAAASTTADAPVADAGQRLTETYRSALTARGTDAEPDAVAAVSAAAADMARVCDESGLQTTG